MVGVSSPIPKKEATLISQMKERKVESNGDKSYSVHARNNVYRRIDDWVDASIDLWRHISIDGAKAPERPEHSDKRAVSRIPSAGDVSRFSDLARDGFRDAVLSEEMVGATILASKPGHQAPKCWA